MKFLFDVVEGEDESARRHKKVLTDAFGRLLTVILLQKGVITVKVLKREEEISIQVLCENIQDAKKPFYRDDYLGGNPNEIYEQEKLWLSEGTSTTLDHAIKYFRVGGYEMEIKVNFVLAVTSTGE